MIKDGENGVLVYPNTVSAWEEGIYKIINSLGSFCLGEKRDWSHWKKIASMKKCYEYTENEFYLC